MANELKTPKMTPEQQRAAFEATARELGCDESPGTFEAAVKKVARQQSAEKKSADEPRTSPRKA